MSLAARVGAAVWLVSGVSGACPCGVVAGPSAALTGVADTWAVGATLSYLREVASFDERSQVYPTPNGVAVGRALLDVSLGRRLSPRWELAATGTVGFAHTALRGVESHGAMLGDTVLRARAAVWTPFGNAAAPTVSAWVGLRLPTAAGAASNPALASVSGVGLGAWEGSLGAEARWNLSRAWQVTGYGEAGLRTTAGLETLATPGPRVLAGVAGVFLPTPRVALSVGLSGWWEAAPTRDGQRVAEGALQRTTCTAAMTVQRGAHWRLGLSAAMDLPVDGLGRNVPALLRGGVSAVWTP